METSRVSVLLYSCVHLYLNVVKSRARRGHLYELPYARYSIE